MILVVGLAKLFIILGRGDNLKTTDFYSKVVKAEPGEKFRVKYNHDGQRLGLLKAFKKDFTVKVFEKVPTIADISRSSLFSTIIYVCPYDKKFEDKPDKRGKKGKKVNTGGILIMECTDAKTKGCITLDPPDQQMIIDGFYKKAEPLGITIFESAIKHVLQVSDSIPEASVRMNTIINYVYGAGQTELTLEHARYFYPENLDDFKPWDLLDKLIRINNPQTLYQEIQDQLGSGKNSLALLSSLITMVGRSYFAVLANANNNFSIEDINSGPVNIYGVKKSHGSKFRNFRQLRNLYMTLQLIKHDCLVRFIDSKNSGRLPLTTRLIAYNMNPKKIPDMGQYHLTGYCHSPRSRLQHNIVVEDSSSENNDNSMKR